MDERETWISRLLHALRWGLHPSTQVCALTGIEPADLKCTGRRSNQPIYEAQSEFYSL